MSSRFILESDVYQTCPPQARATTRAESATLCSSRCKSILLITWLLLWLMSFRYDTTSYDLLQVLAYLPASIQAILHSERHRAWSWTMWHKDIRVLERSKRAPGLSTPGARKKYKKVSFYNLEIGEVYWPFRPKCCSFMVTYRAWRMATW